MSSAGLKNYDDMAKFAKGIEHNSEKLNRATYSGLLGGVVVGLIIGSLLTGVASPSILDGTLNPWVISLTMGLPLLFTVPFFTIASRGLVERQRVSDAKELLNELRGATPLTQQEFDCLWEFCHSVLPNYKICLSRDWKSVLRLLSSLDLVGENNSSICFFAKKRYPNIEGTEKRCLKRDAKAFVFLFSNKKVEFKYNPKVRDVMSLLKVKRQRQNKIVTLNTSILEELEEVLKK